MDGLFCINCHTHYSLNDIRWRCDCGSVLDIVYQAQISLEKIKQRKHTMWRYRESLPLFDDEGYTPLLPIQLYKQQLLIKLEYLLPTGSYKERGASLLISEVKENGIKEAIEDSFGNAACSIAAYSALAEINVPVGKM